MSLRDELYRRFREFLDADSLIADPESQRPFECDGLPLHRELPDGDYLVVVITDAADSVGEVDELDNRASAPISVTAPPLPDLDLVMVTASATAHPGQPFTVQWTVSNHGQVSAGADWADRVYLSNDGTLSGATLLDTVPGPGVLEAGGQYDAELTVNAPSLADGDYHVFVVHPG